MTGDERIEQFRKMAQANPDDDLAHYALGQALVDADRFGEAVNVFKHVIKLNQSYSRAYLLLGQSLEKMDDESGAIDAYQVGYAAAMNRGDLMPANEMKQRLTSLGGSISPDALIAFAQADPEPEDDRVPGPDEVRCSRTKKIGARLSFNPFNDEVGAFIEENISQESWEEWMEMSIKVINELRLDLGDAAGQRAYDEHMRDFLNLPGHFFENKTYS